MQNDLEASRHSCSYLLHDLGKLCAKHLPTTIIENLLQRNILQSYKSGFQHVKTSLICEGKNWGRLQEKQLVLQSGTPNIQIWVIKHKGKKGILYYVKIIVRLILSSLKENLHLPSKNSIKLHQNGATGVSARSHCLPGNRPEGDLLQYET